MLLDAALIFLIAGCEGPAAESGPLTGDTGTTESGTTTDDSATTESTPTDDTGETGTTPMRQGLTGRSGAAFADADSYAGAEDWYFVGEDGLDVCRVRVTMTSVAIRSDCEGCSWAFDLETSDATVEAESDVGCLGVFGMDASTVGSLDGAVVSYGFIHEYYGHADVLSVDAGAGWDVVGFANWDDASFEFSYDLVDGYVSY